MDLDAYFARIGCAPPREPTLATLNAIAAAHVQTIPFENIDVLLGRGVSVELADVEAKLVRGGRGGYCFEHNTLLLHALDALGFAPRPYSARVRIGRPREQTPARTHLFVGVTLEGRPYLADVGVGGLSPTCALRLDTEEPQPTPHEPRRIVREDGRWFHQARLGEAWSDVCEFTLEEMPPIDRVVANWYTSAHPTSHFRGNLLVARATPHGRLTLLNRELTERWNDGRSEKQTAATPAELHAMLTQRFGLALAPEVELQCPGLAWT